MFVGIPSNTSIHFRILIDHIMIPIFYTIINSNMTDTVTPVFNNDITHLIIIRIALNVNIRPSRRAREIFCTGSRYT